MDERIREMRLKLDKIAWEPEQSEKNKRAFAFIVVYSDYLIQQAEKAEELESDIKANKKSVDWLLYQNKRYKEALEKITKENSLYFMDKIARQALEGEQQ